MASQNPFVLKVCNIRYNYGDSASEYFKNNPVCERCGEERITILNVHHLLGKNIEIFKVLCFNCHMLEHSSNPNYTYKDYLEENKIRDGICEIRKERNERIVILHKSGLSLRKIGVQEGISHLRVKQILDAVG